MQLSQLEKAVLTSASPLRRNPRSISRGTLRAMATSIVGILATRSSADALLFVFVLFCFRFIAMFRFSDSDEVLDEQS